MKAICELILSAAVLAACSQSPIGDTAVIAADSQRAELLPVVESELSAVVRDNKTASLKVGEDFFIEGAFRLSRAAANQAAIVTVKVIHKTPDGKSIIMDSRSAKPIKKGDRRYSFRGDVTAPRKAGEYIIQARSGKLDLGERVITER